MTITAADIIDAIIVREGDKYTARLDDRGGPTKFGVTQATLSQYRGYAVTPTEVAALARGEAVAVYQKLFVAPFQVFAGMSARVLGLIVDSGVQHGTGRVMKWLQAAIGATPDGAVGPGTQAKWAPYASAALDQNELYRALLRTRIKFYAAITAGNLADNDKDGVPDNLEMLGGWMNRIAEFI